MQLDEKALRLAGGTTGIAIYAGAEAAGWTDYTLNFKMKTETASGGLFQTYLRTAPQAEPANTFYFLNIYEDTTKYYYRLNKELASAAGSVILTQGEDAGLAFAAGPYYSVRIVVSAANIKAYFNGSAAPFIDYTDPGVSGPSGEAAISNGGFGFGASGTFYVDDIALTEL